MSPRITPRVKEILYELESAESELEELGFEVTLDVLRDGKSIMP